MNTILLVNRFLQTSTIMYLEEGLVLLHGFQQVSKTDALEWNSYAEVHSDAQMKHLLLYNWIALSLVRHDDKDVAEVASFVFHDHLKIYYAKNDLQVDEDKQHASELGALVQRCASEPSPLKVL